MKVYVSKNRQNLNYLVKMSAHIKPEDINKILESHGPRLTVRKLMRHSVAIKKVSSRDQRNARLWADFIISDDYVAQKLG